MFKHYNYTTNTSATIKFLKTACIAPALTVHLGGNNSLRLEACREKGVCACIPQIQGFFGGEYLLS